MSATRPGACPLRAHVDPRLTRFSAGATAAVMAVALLLVDALRSLAIGLLATQVAVFAFTAFVSFQWSVWARIYAQFIWPRVAPSTALDDARPHRFAQLLGFLLTGPAVVLFAIGADGAGYTLTAVAIVLTALNALTGLCLGCKAYPLFRWP
jgi:hypothetical protein